MNGLSLRERIAKSKQTNPLSKSKVRLTRKSRTSSVKDQTGNDQRDDRDSFAETTHTTVVSSSPILSKDKKARSTMIVGRRSSSSDSDSDSDASSSDASSSSFSSSAHRTRSKDHHNNRLSDGKPKRKTDGRSKSRTRRRAGRTSKSTRDENSSHRSSHRHKKSSKEHDREEKPRSSKHRKRHKTAYEKILTPPLVEEPSENERANHDSTPSVKSDVVLQKLLSKPSSYPFKREALVIRKSEIDTKRTEGMVKVSEGVYTVPLFRDPHEKGGYTGLLILKPQSWYGPVMATQCMMSLQLESAEARKVYWIRPDEIQVPMKNDDICFIAHRLLYGVGNKSIEEAAVFRVVVAQINTGIPFVPSQCLEPLTPVQVAAMESFLQPKNGSTVITPLKSIRAEKQLSIENGVSVASVIKERKGRSKRRSNSGEASVDKKKKRRHTSSKETKKTKRSSDIYKK